MRRKRWPIVARLGAVLWPGFVACERAYPLGCSKEAPAFYDFDSSVFPPPALTQYSYDDFGLTRRLGTGKFSDVFEAIESEPQRLVVVKCLKPVSERKIRRELLVLSHVADLPNLVRLRGMVLPPEYRADNRLETQLPRMPALILEHAGPTSQWFCHGSEGLSDYEVRYYLYHLLVALDALHAKGIMHRDVKPRNVLLNRSGRSMYRPLTLIDLGLADFFRPGQRFNVRVASRHYKSPELLVGFESYDYAVDMWGVGCILAGLLLHREPFFRGKDNPDQLAKIVECLGTHNLERYLERYGIQASADVRKLLINQSHAKDLLSLLAPNAPLPPLAGLDLLSKLLVYDHVDRWTAQQAMAHPYFDAVRQRVQTEVDGY